MLCFVTTSESFQALGGELQVYQAASGAMLNYQKSIGLTLGTWSSQMTRPLPIQWTTESVKVLGLVYTPSYYDTVVQNWALVLQKFRATLSKWAQRDLSFFGRAQVLKTYVMSKLCYVAHTLTMPRVTMEQVESLMWEFLWQGSTHQVRQSVCISPVGKGGLGMPYLPSKLAAFQSRCLQRLFDSVNNAAWKSLAAVFIEPATGQYRMGLGIFAASTWKPDYRNMVRTPPFYRNLLRLWLRYDGGA